jgi:cytochrome c2
MEMKLTLLSSKIRKNITSILFINLLLLANVFADSNSNDDPALTIITPKEKKVLTRTQLLKTKNITQITMTNSRAYPGVKLNFTAIKLCDILRPLHIRKNDMVELITSDNFSSLVPAKVVMACTTKTSIAYLAIEPKQHPWPQLKYNNPDQYNRDMSSAGPYKIIWLHPEKSYISNEYWAWKVKTIKIHYKLNEKIYLPAPSTKNLNIQNGYNAYVSRCLGCHTINRIGKAKIGPDLNVPVSAVKRFNNDNLLKKFIRNPQSVRAKKNDRMSGTSEQFLSNKDLDDLVLYLHYMAEHK